MYASYKADAIPNDIEIRKVTNNSIVSFFADVFPRLKLTFKIKFLEYPKTDFDSIPNIINCIEICGKERTK